MSAPPEDDQPNQPTRFEAELEFIQALANPQYLNYLAQNKFLENDEFLAYLKYLEYWREPRYARFLVYPNCLHILTLLQQPVFRQEISRADVAKLFMDDFYMKWLNKAESTDVDAVTEPKSDDPEIKSEPQGVHV